MIQDISQTANKADIRNAVERLLGAEGFTITEVNDQKPWGIEFKIHNNESMTFFAHFFSNLEIPEELTKEPYGPKILAIEPMKRLSWHVHERKDAYLRVLQGNLHVYSSPTDEQVEPVTKEEGDLVHIPELIRHRLGAIDKWVIVVEISRNVFPDHPSDDADERRISDDFGRV